MKRGSALVMAIWTIAVLSVMVMTFISEAHLQTGIDIYARDRVTVDFLTDAGIVIAETLMKQYPDAPSTISWDNLDEELEKDRWLLEKYKLKSSGTTSTAPIVIDTADEDGGTVTIRISSKESKLNVNTLYDGEGGGGNSRAMWEAIFTSLEIPEEIDDVTIGEDRHTSLHLWDLLIASWTDWRDTDDNVTKSQDDRIEGGEKEYYNELREYYEKKHDNENVIDYEPRNGEIQDLKELGKIKGFRDLPAVLFGGVLNPEADKKEQVTCKGLISSGILDVFGSGKINVNAASKEILMMIPGIYDDGRPEESEAIADAIIESRQPQTPEEIAQHGEDDERGPIKDWNDLLKRTENEIGEAASGYLIYAPETYFDITITGQTALGFKHTINATAMIKDNKVLWIRWEEDPGEK